MGQQQQSIKKNFFWPSKGEIEVWTIQELKILSEVDSRLSEQQNESLAQNPIEYSLTWITKSNQILFTVTRKSDNGKVKFIVDQGTGKLIKTEYIQLEKDEISIFDELSPQTMWKCWVEIWQGQPKKNDYVLNKLESQENAQFECMKGSVFNPIVKLYRERREQVQFITRQLFYTNQNDNSKSSKYKINMQFCKSQIWMFNWDLKQKVVPQPCFLELQDKLQLESLSFYQYTLN
ncbi:unnamed protein product [Paramecium pentaurelia]|uniref:Uncharacterized protein n=1 Tax=Paramecium pentaurelia TaxID=43138 RepID=A0A8S1SRD8_9CILI|nr:unnamed protein product [Paramecium pentaurelia]